MDEIHIHKWARTLEDGHIVYICAKPNCLHRIDFTASREEFDRLPERVGVKFVPVEATLQSSLMSNPSVHGRSTFEKLAGRIIKGWKELLTASL